jgi:DNA-binding Lrp family transcriptional regulator
MVASQTPNSVRLDRLDAQIVRCLQLSPRAPFRRIGAVLGVSEQTVARRYRAMQRAGAVHIIATVDPTALGESDWMVRIRCRPDATLDLGRALAQRPDVAWVSVSAGGAELMCAVRSRSQQEREHLLVERLPRSSAVLDLTASVVLRRFVGGSVSKWLGLAGVLTPEQEEQASGDGPARRPPDGTGALQPEDYPMLDLLARDGRAPYRDLARAAATTEARAARRLTALLESGTVYLDVDVASALIGFPTSAYLWLSVPPADLDRTCHTLAQHPEAPFVAAISGRANVLVSVTCRSLDDLYRYVTERIGAIQGVQAIEVSPVLRRLKQAGTLVEGDRLVT